MVPTGISSASLLAINIRWRRSLKIGSSPGCKTSKSIDTLTWEIVATLRPSRPGTRRTLAILLLILVTLKSGLISSMETVTCPSASIATASLSIRRFTERHPPSATVVYLQTPFREMATFLWSRQVGPISRPQTPSTTGTPFCPRA